MASTSSMLTSWTKTFSSGTFRRVSWDLRRVMFIGLGLSRWMSGAGRWPPRRAAGRSGQGLRGLRSASWPCCANILNRSCSRKIRVGLVISVVSRNGTVSFVRSHTDRFFGSPRDLRPPGDVAASRTLSQQSPARTGGLVLARLPDMMREFLCQNDGSGGMFLLHHGWGRGVDCRRGRGSVSTRELRRSRMFSHHSVSDDRSATAGTVCP